MKLTDKTLLEQMRITEFEVASRRNLFSITPDEAEALLRAKPIIEGKIDDLVTVFYEFQTSIPDISLVIGDSGTLSRLKIAQRRYVLDLFVGFYDVEYVNNRLRIGLVHKRMGVEPKLYLSAIQTLKMLLVETINNNNYYNNNNNEKEKIHLISSIEKLLMFDISLVFDTYIRSLISEIEASKEKSEQYARVLEDKVKERTVELENMSRTDPLTGLLNMRHLGEVLTKNIRAAQRRREFIAIAYIDINDFKSINDTYGHLRGDEVLRNVADAIKNSTRLEDYSFRYGGDEFCVVMPKCTEEQAKDVFKNRVLEEVCRKEKTLKMSIGFAQTGNDEYISADELIRLADQRMYDEKRASKNVTH